jgi:glycogen synthase kinase 3 beta
MLVYAPEERIKPFEMLAHTVFDELRNPDCKLPNGRALPPLFNFTVRLQQIDIRSVPVMQ